MATTSCIEFGKNQTNKHFRVAITSLFFRDGQTYDNGKFDAALYFARLKIIPVLSIGTSPVQISPLITVLSCLIHLKYTLSLPKDG
ncbi:MAG: hypothetical protein DRR08_23295 [Candidatus Parabeggiatoa sp. nov. 2]|nr:MAG: hypothetical protein B6247_11895 [Beggiatoa sp. 4572_84]RKZ55805.1 MAG: hypothetical protein DRR08_23295 [Gammaproteobacteria bacterium]